MWITTSWRRFLAYEIGYLLFFAALFATLSLTHVPNALRASVILYSGSAGIPYCGLPCWNYLWTKALRHEQHSSPQAHY
jgi:hypothetical protein